MNISESDRQIILGAIDSLGVALLDHDRDWTIGERTIYEEAIKLLTASSPYRKAADFEGKTAWQGTVEVFDLIGHPKAKRVYAWTYHDGDQNKTIAVLAIPPVDSPQSAVKVAIASKAKHK